MKPTTWISILKEDIFGIPSFVSTSSGARTNSDVGTLKTSHDRPLQSCWRRSFAGRGSLPSTVQERACGQSTGRYAASAMIRKVVVTNSSRHKLHEAPNLYICNASIFPNPTDNHDDADHRLYHANLRSTCWRSFARETTRVLEKSAEVASTPSAFTQRWFWYSTLANYRMGWVGDSSKSWIGRNPKQTISIPPDIWHGVPFAISLCSPGPPVTPGIKGRDLFITKRR